MGKNDSIVPKFSTLFTEGCMQTYLDSELQKGLLLDKDSLASSLNGYMYSNGASLNVAFFILMANHYWFIIPPAFMQRGI